MKEITCPLCHCDMRDNSHGLDQNDLYEDEAGEFRHTGRCTYCKFCNPNLFRAILDVRIAEDKK